MATIKNRKMPLEFYYLDFSFLSDQLPISYNRNLLKTPMNLLGQTNQDFIWK